MFTIQEIYNMNKLFNLTKKKNAHLAISLNNISGRSMECETILCSYWLK